MKFTDGRLYPLEHRRADRLDASPCYDEEPQACRLSEIHPQPDDQAEIVRLGPNAIRANFRVGDAIPDEGHIQVEPLGQSERKRADAVMSGLADGLAGVLSAVFENQFQALGDVPVEAGPKGERERVFPRRLPRLAGIIPDELIGRTGGDVPLQTRAVNEIIAGADAGGDASRQVLERIFVIFSGGQDQIEPPGKPQIEFTVDALIVGALDLVNAAEIADVIEAETRGRGAALQVRGLSWAWYTIPCPSAPTSTPCVG